MSCPGGGVAFPNRLANPLVLPMNHLIVEFREILCRNCTKLAMVAPRRIRFPRYSGALRPTLVGVCALILGFILFSSTLRTTRPSHRPALGQNSAPVAMSASTGPQQRKIYPLSVIHGGAYSEEELSRARRTDAVVAAHYADFGPKPRFERLKHDALVYVSYRQGDRVYWSQTRHRVPQGETVISDGNCMARARCGNRLSATRQAPVADREPAEEVLNTPDAPDAPVTYKLAELPLPGALPLHFDLPSTFPTATPVSAAPTALAASPAAASPGTYLAPGPGGFFGGGGGPVALGGGPGVLGGGPGAAVGALPRTTTGGTSLPLLAATPLATPIPVGVPLETVVQVTPEPSSIGYCVFGLLLALACLPRRRPRASILRG